MLALLATNDDGRMTRVPGLELEVSAERKLITGL
jgi:hypothetical protein